MGKKVLLVLLALFLNLSVFSQIQRDFYGLQLGHSNRSDVEKRFKELGKNVSETDESISVESLTFFGEYWPNVTFSFYKDKICSVHFLNFEIVTPKEELDTIWTNLDRLLVTKYKGNDSASTDEIRSFKDSDTLVSLSYSSYNGSECVVLVFFDINSMLAKEADSDM